MNNIPIINIRFIKINKSKIGRSFAFTNNKSEMERLFAFIKINKSEMEETFSNKILDKFIKSPKLKGELEFI